MCWSFFWTGRTSALACGKTTEKPRCRMCHVANCGNYPCIMEGVDSWSPSALYSIGFIARTGAQGLMPSLGAEEKDPDYRETL
jgi:hypothetical protein